MAPRIPEILPCNTFYDVEAHLASVRQSLSLEETEETWDTISNGLLILGALARGGACNFPREFLPVLKPFGSAINKAMKSERSRLSGAATTLVSELATGLQRDFEPLLPTFIPSLISVTARSNKLFVARAKGSLLAIIEHTQLVSIMHYLRQAVTDKSTTARIATSEAVLACLNSMNPPDLQTSARAEDVEAVIRQTATDASAEVRKVGKKIFEAYATLLPGRVDAFVDPLSPIVRKYLNIKNGPIKKPLGPAASLNLARPPTDASVAATKPNARRERPHASHNRTESQSSRGELGSEARMPTSRPVSALSVNSEASTSALSDGGKTRSRSPSRTRAASQRPAERVGTSANPKKPVGPARRAVSTTTAANWHGGQHAPDRGGSVAMRTAIAGNLENLDVQARPQTGEGVDKSRPRGGARRVLIPPPSLPPSGPRDVEEQAKAEEAQRPRRVEVHQAPEKQKHRSVIKLAIKPTSIPSPIRPTKTIPPLRVRNTSASVQGSSQAHSKPTLASKPGESSRPAQPLSLLKPSLSKFTKQASSPKAVRSSTSQAARKPLVTMVRGRGLTAATASQLAKVKARRADMQASGASKMATGLTRSAVERLHLPAQDTSAPAVASLGAPSTEQVQLPLVIDMPSIKPESIPLPVSPPLSSAIPLDIQQVEFLLDTPLHSQPLSPMDGISASSTDDAIVGSDGQEKPGEPTQIVAENAQHDVNPNVAQFDPPVLPNKSDDSGAHPSLSDILPEEDLLHTPGSRRAERPVEDLPESQCETPEESTPVATSRPPVVFSTPLEKFTPASSKAPESQHVSMRFTPTMTPSQALPRASPLSSVSGFGFERTPAPKTPISSLLRSIQRGFIMSPFSLSGAYEDDGGEGDITVTGLRPGVPPSPSPASSATGVPGTSALSFHKTSTTDDFGFAERSFESLYEDSGSLSPLRAQMKRMRRVGGPLLLQLEGVGEEPEGDGLEEISFS